MAADLHIHIFEGITEDDLRKLKSCTLGSKYFDMFSLPDEEWREATRRVNSTPNIWIGEVSWLKAGVFGDQEDFVPETVGRIDDLIGEDLPVLTEELMKGILDAFDLPNKTGYSLNDRGRVAEFLKSHLGKRLFTVSW